MNNKITVVIVDGQSLIREALCSLVESTPNRHYQIIGTASDGLDAIRVITKVKPDIVLMGLCLHSMRGIEVIKDLRSRKVPSKIIVVTASNGEQDIASCLMAGGNGFVHKMSDKRELFLAMEKVMEGVSYMCSMTKRKMLPGNGDDLAEAETGQRRSSLLTTRESQVLRLVTRGLKNREIGEKLCVSIKTIEKHRANLRLKLKVETTAEMIVYGLSENLV